MERLVKGDIVVIPFSFSDNLSIYKHIDMTCQEPPVKDWWYDMILGLFVFHPALL